MSRTAKSFCRRMLEGRILAGSIHVPKTLGLCGTGRWGRGLGGIFACPKNQNPRSIWNWKVRRGLGGIFACPKKSKLQVYVELEGEEGFRQNICMPKNTSPLGCEMPKTAAGG